MTNHQKINYSCIITFYSEYIEKFKVPFTLNNTTISYLYIYITLLAKTYFPDMKRDHVTKRMTITMTEEEATTDQGLTKDHSTLNREDLMMTKKEDLTKVVEDQIDQRTKKKRDIGPVMMMIDLEEAKEVNTVQGIREGQEMVIDLMTI